MVGLLKRLSNKNQHSYKTLEFTMKKKKNTEKIHAMRLTRRQIIASFLQSVCVHACVRLSVGGGQGVRNGVTGFLSSFV